MIIGFIGDIHGRACHALAILLTWQSMRKKIFDLVVQVGDLGVMPLPQSGEIPYDRFSQWDPAVYDLCSLILAEGPDAQLARDTRTQLTSSILVVAGNHDEFSAIRNSVETKSSVPIPLDPHGLFKCVPDGFTLEVGKETIGFCEGGDPEVLQHSHPKDIDILVSHEGGFGSGADADNLAEGPQDLLEYLRTSKPRYHVFGHFHHPVEPRKVYETECIQVASVVSNPRDPELQVINEGCIGALDTETGDFEFVSGDWLSIYKRDGGFQLLADAINRTSRRRIN